MRILVALTMILTLLHGCASTEQRRSNIERDISEMYSTHYSAEIQRFFVEEAINAGVRKIRAMKPSEKRPSSNKNEIIGCARVNLDSKVVLIEVNQPLCLMPAHLAHEIAQFLVQTVGLMTKFSIVTILKSQDDTKSDFQTR